MKKLKSHETCIRIEGKLSQDLAIASNLVANGKTPLGRTKFAEILLQEAVTKILVNNEFKKERKKTKPLKKIEYKHDNPYIENRDWRLQAITFLKEDWLSEQKVLYQKESTVVEVKSDISICKTKSSIRIPNATSLYLSLAFDHSNQAKEAIKNTFNIDEVLFNRDGFDVHQEVESVFFDYFQHAKASIIFSFMALESFANVILPEDFSWEVERDGIKKTFTREEIERKCSISEKISDILPKIQNVDSPKGGQLWEKFDSLRILRDRITHLKTKDIRKSSIDDSDYIWARLMQPSVLEYPYFAIRLMEYFHPNDPPRWLAKCPFRLTDSD